MKSSLYPQASVATTYKEYKQWFVVVNEGVKLHMFRYVMTVNDRVSIKTVDTIKKPLARMEQVCVPGIKVYTGQRQSHIRTVQEGSSSRKTGYKKEETQSSHGSNNKY